MSDENDDPTKKRPKPVDARSAADSNNSSSLESPKSTTVNNVSQRLPSTSAEVSVSDILSTNEKRASVSIRDSKDEKHRSSTEPGDRTDQEQSQMDLGVATRELTRLLHIGNENTSATGTHLNPDAPDFKPLDFNSTYHSELAPAHVYRRATHSDSYENRNSRTRFHSETYQNSDSSTIRPLLSIVPQYIPHHRKSWNTIMPLSKSSSNSWWPQEYSNPSSAASSYQSKPAYQIYTPLMEQQPLTDENEYTYNQQQHKYPPKRPRAYSGRGFANSNQKLTTRKRSHSGPDTPLSPSSAHLNGIHSLTRIMVDLLRMINPIPEEQKETNESILSTNLTEDSTIENRYQQGNQFIDAENILIKNEMSTTAAPLSSLSIDRTADMFDGDNGLSTGHNDHQDNQIGSLISTPDESFYDVMNEEEEEEEETKLTSMSVPGTPAARATN
jgi:hypothetical protein